VVCLQLGPVHERRPFARQLANDLLTRADKLMYEAKAQGSRRIASLNVRMVNGGLHPVSAD
jgi:PleD family two-component response regulator